MIKKHQQSIYPGGILTLNDSLQICEVSPWFCNLFDCHVDDIIGLYIENLFSHKDRKGILNFHNKLSVYEGGFIDVVILLCINSREFLTRLRMSQKQKQWFAIVENILSESNDLFREFNLMQARWRSIVRNSSEGIAILDSNGSLIEFNSRFLEMMEFRSSHNVLLNEDAILNKNLFTLINHPEFEDIKIAFEEAKVRKKAKFKKEIYYNHHYFNIELASIHFPVQGFAGCSCSIKDITWQKKLQAEIRIREQAEATLRQEREKFLVAFRSSPHPSSINRLSDGCYIEVNESWLDTFGYSREQVIGKNPTQLNLIVEIEKINKLSNLLQSEKIVRNFEADFRASSGEIKTLLISAEIIEIEGEYCLLSVTNDITDRKKVENALRLIVEGTAAKIGSEFFNDLVRYLAEVLQVRYAIVTELVKREKNKVRALAFWTGFSVENNFEYDLTGTPCKNVLYGKNSYFPKNLQAAFPDDAILTELNAQSFLGIPLTDAAGNVLGTLAVLDDKPMSQHLDKELILKIFAARAGAELERLQAEDALRESQRTLSTLMSNLPGIAYRCLYDEFWTMKFVSEGCVDLTGYHSEALIDNQTIAYEELTHPEDREFVRRQIENAKVLHQPFEIVYRIFTATGEAKWIWEKGQVIFSDLGEAIALEGFMTDISDRKQMEEALERQIQRALLLEKITQEIRQTLDIKQIFQSTVSQITETFSVSRCVILAYRNEPIPHLLPVAEYLQRGHNSTLGIEIPIHHNLYGKSLLASDTAIASWNVYKDRLLKGMEPLCHQMNLKSILAVRTSYQDLANGVICLHQCDRYREWTADEIRLLEAVAAQVGIAISQANLLEQEKQQREALAVNNLALEQAKEAADAASKAKGEFLSKMSHELRTPLNAILGFTQLLDRDRTLTPPQQEYLKIISRAGEHLLDLINDVLEMSKIESGKISFHESSFDLYRLLNSLEKMFQLKAESKGLQLIFEKAENVDQFVKTDESKLRQVLINLLSNAIKFTESGGVVLRVEQRKILTCINDCLSHQTSVQSEVCRDSKSHLFFEIEDTGPGIDPEEINTLFQPFVQTEIGRQSQSGTGLGLSISHQFVQIMGGEIKVSSTLNRGTIFTFNVQILPAEVEEIATPRPTRRVVGLEPNQPNYRILIAEDKWESRTLLVNLLSPLGFEVREAINGAEAINLWQTWQPHLIWMDMQMPIMDGYQATRQIKSTTKGQATVIIALTASAFAENRAMVLDAGCDDFLSKPFREEVIFEKMSKYLQVRYVYDDTNIDPEISTSFQPKSALKSLSAAALMVMPSEWRMQVYQAAFDLDEELLQHLIAEIPEGHKSLADALQSLAKQLRFDKIIELIEETQHE